MPMLPSSPVPRAKMKVMAAMLSFKILRRLEIVQNYRDTQCCPTHRTQSRLRCSSKQKRHRTLRRRRCRQWSPRYRNRMGLSHFVRDRDLFERRTKAYQR